MELSDLHALRSNADKANAADVVAACDAELAIRIPPRRAAQKDAPKLRFTDYVAGYHFVCARDRGVQLESDGTFWTGSWIVSNQEVEKNLRYGASVALHENKAELSYRQGQLLDRRPMDRGMINKTSLGLALRVRPTENPLFWAGAGAGEKGYRWAPLPAEVLVS